MNGPCTDFATALVCHDDGAGNRTTLIAHYEYAKSAVGSSILRAVRYTTADGTPVDTSAGTVAPGPCQSAASEVEYVQLCDFVPKVTFLRWFTLVDGVPTGTFTDTTLDGAPYTVVSFAEPGECKFNEGLTIWRSSGTQPGGSTYSPSANRNSGVSIRGFVAMFTHPSGGSIDGIPMPAGTHGWEAGENSADINGFPSAVTSAGEFIFHWAERP
jgi:hypothetical protein